MVDGKGLINVYYVLPDGYTVFIGVKNDLNGVEDKVNLYLAFIDKVTDVNYYSFYGQVFVFRFQNLSR